MSRPDKQYVALAGKPDGEVWLVDYRQPEGQTHRLLRAAGSFTPLHIALGDIATPPGWHDALKISGVVHAYVTAGEVLGGSEDVLDINHSQSLLVKLTRAVPRGRYVATIKGGSRGVELMIAEQQGHGRETDIDLGNWSDQSAERTKLVSLTIATPDRSPVRVRVLHAHAPALSAGGRYKVSAWMKGWYQHVMAVLKKLKIA